jgi:hypothetical protein
MIVARCQPRSHPPGYDQEYIIWVWTRICDLNLTLHPITIALIRAIVDHTGPCQSQAYSHNYRITVKDKAPSPATGPANCDL